MTNIPIAESRPQSELSLELPTKLSIICSDLGVNLADNTQNFPILNVELSNDEQRKILVIKDTLMQLPLVHSTNASSLELILGNDMSIMPHSQLTSGSVRHNTGDLDVSLGLNECTFMNWGAIEKKGYGRFHVLIDPAVVFTDTRCYVTPTDINHSVMVHKGQFKQLSEEDQLNIKTNYLGKIVSGPIWHEIVARQILYDLMGGISPAINSYNQLGEIKFTGTLPPEAVIEVAGPDDEHRWWRKMLDIGFIPGPVSRSRFGSSSYDVTADQLGRSETTASNYWKSHIN